MVNEQAQAAKDKGNTAFKAGDYPTAIGHYTSAILADKNDPTYPLNRAAAYLKLGKNQDAERDCTLVLELSKNNVKGLFRRGQARAALGKLLDARKDFSDVLLVEPSNLAAQDEMKRLTILIQQDKMKSKSPSTMVQSSLEPATVTKRRRVPIKIVDSSGNVVQTSAGGSTSSGLTQTESLDVRRPIETLEAVSSRSLKSTVISESEGPSKTQTNSKTSSFSETKAARDSARPTRVGGGIFKSSGESTIFSNRERHADSRSNGSEKPLASSQFPLPAQDLRIAYKAPSTLFDFNRMWLSLTSTEERWRYLNVIEPTTLPRLCENSLEPSLLVSILETFVATLSTTKDLPNVKPRMQDYMESFRDVPRFGTVVLFLSKQERELARQVWTLLGVEKPSAVWGSVV